MKILIVDDSRFLRLTNERVLTKAGYEVTTASDGPEGLRSAIEHPPDLIVLDMMLPGMSGPEVLRALRKAPATAAVPVMVLTSLPQANANKLLGGATAYFEKSRLAGDEQLSGSFLDAVENVLRKGSVKASAG